MNLNVKELLVPSRAKLRYPCGTYTLNYVYYQRNMLVIEGFARRIASFYELRLTNQIRNHECGMGVQMISVCLGSKGSAQ